MCVWVGVCSAAAQDGSAPVSLTSHPQCIERCWPVRRHGCAVRAGSVLPLATAQRYRRRVRGGVNREMVGAGRVGQQRCRRERAAKTTAQGCRPGFWDRGFARSGHKRADRGRIEDFHKNPRVDLDAGSSLPDAGDVVGCSGSGCDALGSRAQRKIRAGS